MVAFFLEYIIENMLLPGKVENWVVITDFEKSGLSDLGFGSIKKVMNLLTDYYRCRLGNNYVVNPSKTVYYIWKCLGPFLDEVVIEKVKILNKPTPDEIFAHCNRHQVEEKYGGKAKNVEVYWPPTMPCAPYTLDGELNEHISENSVRIQEHKEPSNESQTLNEPNKSSDSIKNLNDSNEDIQPMLQPEDPKSPSEDDQKASKSPKKSKKVQKKQKKSRKEKKSKKKHKKSYESQEKPIEFIEELSIQEKSIENHELEKSVENENEVQVAFSELLENSSENSGIIQETNSNDQNCGICSIMLKKDYNKCQVF